MQKRIRTIFWIVFFTVGVIILVLLPRIWADLIYPLRYDTYILKEASEFNLPPTLIAGVIFTESHFNPLATSGVGARGLMQIMPTTGAGIASALGDPDFTADKLYDPATNIRYGSWYLRTLLNDYDNDVDVILAAYNGGPGVAKRYQASRDSSTIPLETANFIVKVKRARDTYAQIYGESLGADIGTKLKTEQPKTLWDRIFGWLFK